MDFIFAFILGMALTILVTIPFGLVNLSVLDCALTKSKTESMRVALGATLVEVFFAVFAIFAGGIIHNLLKSNPFVDYISFAILFSIGLLFWFKKKDTQNQSKYRLAGFLKGMALNLISVQVLLFWVIAISMVFSKSLMVFSLINLFFFLIGVGVGKMVILFLYSWLGERIIRKYHSFDAIINRIIGTILIVLSVIQLVDVNIF
jgi:threonine/homoserine/homoserine lactone efflux protein